MSIKQIAKITGFSYATVARALSGTGYCSKEKYQKIHEAAISLNYKPNSSARTLRNNRTEKILFAIPDICNMFYFRMIEGANRELEKHGYYAMICNTEHSLVKELKIIDLLSQKYADGLMLVSFNFSDENIGAIRKTGRPVVLTNRYAGQTENDNFDYVYTDHVKGMELAAEHLLKQGCRKIVLLAGPRDEQTASERISGYFNMHKKYGVPVDENYILDGGFIVEKAYNVFMKFCDAGLPFDGIITANELMCMGVMRYVSQKEAGFVQRKNFVSFDNTDFAENLRITSIDLQQDKIGEESIKLLMDRIENNRVKSCTVYIEPKLVIRY